MSDFNTLLKPGTIGFYQSCEVTQIFLYNKKNNTVTHVYILICLEEKPFEKRNKKFIGKPYPLDKDTQLCMQQYRLGIEELSRIYSKLKKENIWDLDGDTRLLLDELKLLPKQFIPSNEGNRFNKVLKNNFHAGSYVVEFFDESKEKAAILFNSTEEKINARAGHLMKELPLDLSVVRERIGNIIFQFPVTVVDIDKSGLPDATGVLLQFSWHHQLSSLPDCEIQIESSLDNNFMTATLVSYDKTTEQKIITGSTDSQHHIRVWRKQPDLLLYASSGWFLKHLNFEAQIGNSSPRNFTIDGNLVSVPIRTSETALRKKQVTDYQTHIAVNINNAEKKTLANRLSFKQYRNYGHSKALKDIHVLLERHDGNGAYLWDPFLTANDLLQTLFFSPTMGVSLKAIGSIHKTFKQVYSSKAQTPKQIMQVQKQVLDNPMHNNLGLNLEFRMQYGKFGWPFHDRFLLFPGTRSKAPRAYSLGTSLNSFGNDHHILQEASYAQPLLDSFDELWDSLNKPECIVWTSPQP